MYLRAEAAVVPFQERPEHHQSGGATDPAGGPEHVIARLLGHEARYWQQSQARYGLALGPALTDRVVTAGTLVGAEDEASAARLLARIDDLADPHLRGKAAGGSTTCTRPQILTRQQVNGSGHCART
jgi:hypothetical protein